MLSKFVMRAYLSGGLIGATAVCLAAATPASAAEPTVMHRFLYVAMSSDGDHIATVEGDTSPSGGEPRVRALIIRSLSSKSQAQVALPCGAVAECWPASPIWSADGKSLTFALRTPGSHKRSLFTVLADGTQLQERLVFNGTITALKFGPGGRLAMLAVEGANKEVGATQAGAPITGDLAGPPTEQRIAILDGKALRWASPPGLFVYEFDWLKDGSGFVGTAAAGDGDSNWWVAKLYAFKASDASARVIYAPPDARHQIADPVVSPDGKRVAFISGLMSDFGVTGGDVYTMTLPNGKAQDITPSLPATAQSLTWDCAGHLRAEILAGAETQIADLGDGTAPATPRVLWHGQESISGDAAGLSQACPSAMTATEHQSFTSPPELEAGPLGAWHDITSANAGLTMPLTAQSLNWQSDGMNVQGWLLLPTAHKAGKIPLITVVHGGPASASRPGFRGPGVYRELLTRGYALFYPNPRGSYGQGETFTQANVRDFGHGDLRDILAGIDAAERIAPIDDNRLGIMGGSYGGFMTMWTVTQTNRFKAGVAAAGISNWISYYGQNGIDEWMIPYFGASAYEDPEVYARSSAINYIRNAKTPVFSYVGAQDIECPAPQTQEFWHALHDLGVPTSYAIYPGEGHGIRDPAHIADAQARTLAWFDRYLK